MIITAIKFILQGIGLATVVWYTWIIVEEYRKIIQEQKEKENGQSQ